MSQPTSKICKTCGAPSRNTPIDNMPEYANDVDHCWNCARILDSVAMMEKVLSRPNLYGQVRIVKLTAQITRPPKGERVIR